MPHISACKGTTFFQSIKIYSRPLQVAGCYAIYMVYQTNVLLF